MNYFGIVFKLWDN